MLGGSKGIQPFSSVVQCRILHYAQFQLLSQNQGIINYSEGATRGELSYLAPLGSENISAPYFKQCLSLEGGITPTPD